MRILPAFAAAALGLALSGCSNQYYERKDTVSWGAGDAVATNMVIQAPDPWPRGSKNTTIAANGGKLARVYRRYVEGAKQGGAAPQNVNNISVNTGGGGPGGGPGGQ
ncbi:pilus assembly protein [Rhodoblastus sp.]|uniref:pilus assembly protein n=1 Tax=Rhodoblastus sp. TaxID=1962975 RepID=UPI003F993BAC